MKVLIHTANEDCWTSLKKQIEIENMLPNETQFLSKSEFYKADVIIFIGCIVLNVEGNDHNMNDIDFYHRANPRAKILMTGCYFKDEYVNDFEYVTLCDNYWDIPEKLGLVKCLQPSNVLLFSEFKTPNFNTSMKDLNPDIIMRIGQGCNHNCSYCPMPKFNGKPQNVELDDLLKWLKYFKKVKDIKNVLLCSGDCAHYGHNGENQLFLLIDEIRKLIPDVKIHFEYIYPKFVIDNIDKFEQLAKENVIGTLPISIQSGSNKILIKMNRLDYCLDDVVDAVTTLHNASKDIDIWTEIIYNFPGEDINDLMHSINISFKFHRVKFLKYKKLKKSLTARLFPDWSNDTKEKDEIIERAMKLHPNGVRED